MCPQKKQYLHVSLHLSKNNKGYAEFKYVRVHNALKISKALNMSIEEIYEYLYEYDEKNCDD